MASFQRRYVETSANHRVVSTGPQSHATTHLAENKALWSLTQEAVRKITITADDLAVQVDMGRVVGSTDLVETHPGEQRMYALRPGRDLYVPFVERHERPAASSIVLVLKRLTIERLRAESPEPRLLTQSSLGLPQHDLFSAFIGVNAPGLPGGKYATEDSLPFWTCHALVLGTQKITQIYDGVPPAYQQ